MDSLYPNTEGASQKVMKGSKSPESVREFMVQDGSRTGQKEDSKALETMMEKVVDWTNHSELNAKYPNECYDCLGLGMGYNRFDWYFEKDAAYPNMDQGITSPLRDLIVEIDDSKFTYGPKQTQPSESESQSSEFDKCESNISAEPSELVSEPVVNESNVECQPKIWETVQNQFTHSQKPKVNKTELGHGFTVRARFVRGSLNHLIRDCDFHEKRMARKANLNNGWNNVQRVNKQNQFVPSAVLTRTGKIPVNTAKASSTKIFSTARQSFNRQIDYPHRALRIRKCDCGGSSNDWVKNASTPIETQEACQGLKEASDVDVFISIVLDWLFIEVAIIGRDSFIGNAESRTIVATSIQSRICCDAAVVGRGFLIEFRGVVEKRLTDGTEALLLPTCSFFWLDQRTADPTVKNAIGRNGVSVKRMGEIVLRFSTATVWM
ncbi:hypothetical protein Tco_1467472 [Tanacetum coccineum]